MELKDFIKQSLIDIIQGVEEAQKELPQGKIVPPVAPSFKSVENGIHHMQAVSFEVFVSVDESKGKEAKIGVVSSIIGAGMGNNSKEGSTHTSKLAFKVPISFREVLHA